MAALAIATPSGIGTPADDDRTQLSFVFGWVCVLAAAFGLVHAISAVLLDSAVVAALASIHGLLAITAAFAHRQARADRLERGVETMIAGLLLTAVAWSVFMPNLRDVAALGPIVALSLAIPYRRGPQLAAVVGAAIVTTIAIVTLGSFRVAPPSPYVEALRAPTLLAGMVLVVFVLWKFSQRLQGEIDRAGRTVELLRTRERAIAATSSGVTIVDLRLAGWPIVYLNPAFERITGYSAAEVLGSDGLMLVGPETDQATLARHRAMVEAGEDGMVTILNYRADGTTFWNELTVSPIRDEAGAVTHCVAIQTDVTASRALAEQLRQAQRMESIGQLAGGIAHDFNNLLTAIGGYTQIARSDVHDLPAAPATESLAESLDEIARASDRAASLTRQLLAFGGRQVLLERVLSLETVISGVLPMLSRLIGEQYRIETHFGTGVPAVVADPGQLEQVLVNLTLNARDASPNGGRIVIATSVGGPVAGSPAARHVRLTVSDEGVGMSQAVQDRMFEPFFTTKGRGQGTGLGLAMVYGIVTQSGGRIGCRSTEGVGTTFEIDLPAHAETAAEPDRPPRGLPHGSLTGHETILLAEDEAPVRALAATILGRAGYRVIESARADDALELARHHGSEIALLLSDVVMPHMSGPELAEELAKIATVPVLFMSGYPDDMLGRGTGVAVELLAKPFTAEALLGAVRRTIDKGVPARDAVEVA
jgi:PAS domain S-box-containing protein